MNKISTKKLSRVELENLSETKNSLFWNPILPAIGISFLLLVVAPFLPILPSKWKGDIVSSLPEYWSAIKHIFTKLPLQFLLITVTSFVYHYLRDFKLYQNMVKDKKSGIKFIGHFNIIDKKHFGNSYRLKTDDLNIKWIKVDEILYNSIDKNSVAKIIVSASQRAYRSDFDENEYGDELIV